MKTKAFFEQMMHCFIFALAVCLATCVAGCSDSEDEDDPLTPTPETPTDDNEEDDDTDGEGEVTFTISNENGGGTGTTDTPVTVNSGEKLSMVISQKSRYTDSDSTVFECEPKATIQLSAGKDAVFTENKDQLTKVEKDPDVNTSRSGENPVRNVIAQKFAVGGQSIDFDLAYEVYSYVNKANETIEMPYIKLNQANFGSSDTSAVSRAAGMSSSSAKAVSLMTEPIVTLTEHSDGNILTRAIKKDTVLYDVNVKFNLEIESVNTKAAEKQTIAFSVNYLGGVVNTTEVKDEIVLDSVVYKPYAFWEEAHDDLPSLCYPCVQRIKYYSNDSTSVINFMDSGHTVELATGTKLSSAIDSYPRTESFLEEREYISETGDSYYETTKDSIVYNKVETITNDSLFRKVASMIVPDLTKVYTREEDYERGSNILLPGDYNNYSRGKSYSDSETYALTEKEKEKIIGNWEDDSRADGWYMGSLASIKYLKICYKKLKNVNPDEYSEGTCEFLNIGPGYHDIFLIIDGKRITFPDVYEEERNTEITDVNDENGVGKKIVYECKSKFFGRNFYAGIEETVYQRQ